MGGGYSSSQHKSEGKDLKARSNLNACSANASKIEEFFRAALAGNRNITAFRSMCTNPSAVSSITNFLVLNYYGRVHFALKLFEEYAGAFETFEGMPGKEHTSMISVFLEQQLKKICRLTATSLSQFDLLEDLVIETFPIYLGSKSYYRWRVFEAQKRRSWLLDAESRILKSTLPEIFTTKSADKDIISADACTYSNISHADVVYSPKGNCNQIPFGTDPAFQSLSEKNVFQSFPQAEPVKCNETLDIQSIINKCDDLAVKDFAEDGSWLLEFIIAVEDLPIAISVLLEANNNGKYPCVYANKAHEKTVKIPQDRLVGMHTGGLDKYLTTNDFLLGNATAIAQTGSSIAVVDCIDPRHIVGLKPVLDEDHSCRYLVCLHEPCKNTMSTCKKMDDLLKIIPSEFVINKERKGVLFKKSVSVACASRDSDSLAASLAGLEGFEGNRGLLF
mmetsp:Transcript_1666/g.1742  ORF Transcript_1666/g.1742 Transcript_1666/m.1742 type:complete len:448 (-) Transcript_1666:472-1815(-)